MSIFDGKKDLGKLIIRARRDLELEGVDIGAIEHKGTYKVKEVIKTEDGYNVRVAPMGEREGEPDEIYTEEEIYDLCWDWAEFLKACESGEIGNKGSAEGSLNEGES